MLLQHKKKFTFFINIKAFYKAVISTNVAQAQEQTSQLVGWDRK